MFGKVIVTLMDNTMDRSEELSFWNNKDLTFYGAQEYVDTVMSTALGRHVIKYGQDGYADVHVVWYKDNSNQVEREYTYSYRVSWGRYNWRLCHRAHAL